MFLIIVFYNLFNVLFFLHMNPNLVHSCSTHSNDCFYDLRDVLIIFLKLRLFKNNSKELF